MANQLRTTALTDRHRQLGARLVDFAGWRMPLEYEGTLAEHERVRTGVGVFDVSHLGTVWVRGVGARDTVAETFTNDPARVPDGRSQYTLCCDDGGGIVDDLIVYRFSDNRWLAVPNAANTGAVVTALTQKAETYGTEVDDVSTEQAIIAVQGPEAIDTVRRATGIDAAGVARLGVVEVDLHGQPVLVCRTGYTGEAGCELIVPDTIAVAVFDALLDAGGTPAGLGARDTLRLEMGYPLHGNDIDPGTNPYEARLGWAVKLDRGPFRGQQALRAIRDGGARRRLLGLRGRSRRPPRPGMAVRHGDEDAGVVTSGSYSPILGVGIGLAYLTSSIAPGEEVLVDVRGRAVPFDVVRPPFVDPGPER